MFHDIKIIAGQGEDVECIAFFVDRSFTLNTLDIGTSVSLFPEAVILSIYACFLVRGCLWMLNTNSTATHHQAKRVRHYRTTARLSLFPAVLHQHLSDSQLSTAAL